MRVGVHVSIAKSFDTAVENAKALGCDTFQIFTRNPRGWKFGGLNMEEVKSFKEKLKQTEIYPPVDHMPYLPNLSCPDDEMYEKSAATLQAEVDRCVQLEIPYLVVHLGSHLGAGREVGLKRIANALNLAVKRAKGNFQICLENMAGTNNSMGSKFEEVKEIFDSVKKKERMGICFDTCLPSGSLVFSNDLPIPIEDVRETDNVLGSDGRAYRVLRLLERSYSGTIVSIKPIGLPFMDVTPEHPILCVKPIGWRQIESKPWRMRMVGPPTWIYARDVKPGYFVVMPKLTLREGSLVDFRPYTGSATRRFLFPSVLPLTDSFAELLGLYLAEGFTFMSKDQVERGKVYFALGHHEKSLIERVRKLVEELFSLKTWIDDSQSAVKVCLGSNILTRFFRDKFGTGATQKKIPTFILHAPPETVRAFLLGYLMGDGCVDRRGLRYTTVSKTLAYQLLHLLAAIDVRGTVYKRGPTSHSMGGRTVAGMGWYVVHVASHEARKLGFSYDFPSAAPLRILRDETRFYLPIKEVRVDRYQGTVYNLTTENGTFTAPFIVTHNCHAYAAGYDLHVEKAVEKTMAKFDEIVGFENLKVVHLNDSENGLGSGRDRHEHIGLGYIGNSGFKAFLHHTAIRDLPLILETPIDERRDHIADMAAVRKLGK